MTGPLSACSVLRLNLDVQFYLFQEVPNNKVNLSRKDSQQNHVNLSLSFVSFREYLMIQSTLHLQWQQVYKSTHSQSQT